MDPQEIVENIFNERQQPNVQHTATTATAIQLFINNAFKNKLLFIYELLQNADDSAQKGQNGYHIEVEIHFFKDYVLFQHNGAPFLAGDVWALSRLGHQIDEINPHPKSHDINKIGYKGVGFKSVFALKDCNCCYIKSGGFCFRFDKNFEEWKSIPYPWQVTPIWTNMEELPEEVRSYCTEDKTSIILKTNLVESLQKINEEVLRARSLLFLRHIKSFIVINHVNGKDEKKVERGKQGKIVKLSIQAGRGKNVRFEYFLLENFTIDVPIKVTESIQNIEDSICPPKLKKAEKITISFAAEMENENNLKEIREQRRKLYVYLPTNATLPFPFTVNAEFLLTADRKSLLEKQAWNAFIFAQLASCKLHWLNTIAGSDFPFKHQFLKIYRKAFEIETDHYGYRTPYNRSLSNELSLVPFIPQEEEESLLLVEDTLVDYTGFNKEFKTTNHAAKDKKMKSENAGIANSQIWNIKLLEEIGAKGFKDSDIIALLREHNHIANTTENNIKLLNFLFKTKHEDHDFAGYLRQTPFLLDTNLILRQPNDVFFPANQDLLPNGITFNLHFLHPDINVHLENTPQLKEWVSLSLGVQYPSKRGMAKKIIDDELEYPENIDRDKAITFGRYFFSVRSGLDDRDKLQLRQLPVVTTSNDLAPAIKCYLSDKYQPVLSLQNLLGNDNRDFNFVSAEYIKEGDRVEDWKRFWLQIGVEQEMKLENIPSQVNTAEKCERQQLISNFPELEAYFQYLDNRPFYNREAVQTANQQGQHQIRNLFTVTLLNYTANNYVFTKLFWQLFFDRLWKEVLRRGRTLYFHNLNKSRNVGDEVPGYIQYFARTQKCLPGVNNTCLTSKELFSPKLAKVLSNASDFNVIDLENISTEQSQFLGIRTMLTFEECLTLLDHCSKQDKVDAALIIQIEQIYEYVNDHFANSEEAKLAANQWNGLLLADNNTFQEKDSLYYLNLPNSPLPNNRQLFLKESRLSSDHLSRVFNLLGITEISTASLSFHSTNETLNNELKSLIRSRLYLLKKYIQFKRGGELKDIEVHLLKKLNGTEFFTADTLQITYPNHPEIYQNTLNCFFEAKNNRFYYLEHWRQIENIYTITRQLCLLLETEDIETEFQIFLTSDEGSIVRWLRNMGIDVRNEVGYLGEQQAFKYLAENLKLQFPNAFIIENDTEFQLRDNESRPLALLIWNNSVNESTFPYDLKLTLFDYTSPTTEAIQYIEIKTTSDENKDIIYITLSEWEFMVKNKEQYILYRIYLDYSDNYRLLSIVEIVEPLQYIIQGKLLPIETVPLELISDKSDRKSPRVD